MYALKHHNAVAAWLAVCLLLITAMVFVGGYTRLSGSGLSITEWKPIHGVVPPLTISEWEEEFAAYKTSPQYQKINKGMSLDEFKTIFWPEYWHRVLGRLIGAVFFFPLLYFALTGCLSKRFGWRLAGIFLLGGLQGAVGWIMVKSGLQNDPHVSHLKLAMHLSLAFSLFGLILWAQLDIKKKSNPQSPMPKAYILWFTLLCLQIVYGAFMAGLRAGLVYNTWPTMNGEWLPAELRAEGGVIYNLTMVQFIHRTLAVIVALGFIFWWYRNRAYVKNNHLGKAAAGVAVVIALQFALGVLTLIHAVPLPLALAHQMTALLLFALSVVLLHRLCRV